MRAIEYMLQHIHLLKNKALWQHNIEVEAIIIARIKVQVSFLNAALDLIERKKYT